jgi:hypothetical protein
MPTILNLNINKLFFCFISQGSVTLDCSHSEFIMKQWIPRYLEESLDGRQADRKVYTRKGQHSKEK